MLTDASCLCGTDGALTEIDLSDHPYKLCASNAVQTRCKTGPIVKSVDSDKDCWCHSLQTLKGQDILGYCANNELISNCKNGNSFPDQCYCGHVINAHAVGYCKINDDSSEMKMY